MPALLGSIRAAAPAASVLASWPILAMVQTSDESDLDRIRGYGKNYGDCRRYALCCERGRRTKSGYQ